MEVVEDLTDYKKVEEQLKKEITDEGRFVRIEDRQDSGVLTEQIISSLSHGNNYSIPNSIRVAFAIGHWAFTFGDTMPIAMIFLSDYHKIVSICTIAQCPKQLLLNQDITKK